MIFYSPTMAIKMRLRSLVFLSVAIFAAIAWPVSAQVAFPPSLAASAPLGNDALRRLGSTGQGATLGTPALRGLAGQAGSADGQTFEDLSPEATRAGQAPQRPSQFQRFVLEATGQLLPVYGSRLFTVPQSYAPVTNIAAPANYLLGVGDEVQIQIWGAADFNAILPIDRNGQIVLPKAGAVNLAGVAVGQLDQVLRAHLGKVFTNFNLSASVGRLRSIQVYVVGEAQRPGTYTVSSLSTLINALFVSGGPNANGSMRSIQLRRGSQVVTEIDLYDFVTRGDKSKDAVLQPGDVIVIPPAGPRVAVTGAYDHAAIYELKGPQNTIAQVLGLGGGVPAMANVQKALLERIVPSATPPRQVLDLALDATGLAQPMRDGDVLTLLNISPAFANAVTLKGTVAEPLRYAWSPGMRLLDLIPEREALITKDYYRRKNVLVQSLKKDESKDPTEKGAKSPVETVSETVDQIRTNLDQINWDYAVIERLDRNTLVNQLIPFNLGKAVIQKDPAHNLPLQAGDVVTIFSQKDLALPLEKKVRLVRVEGEVAASGVYQAQPGETLPQLIRRIGGLTPQAYVFGAEFTRVSVREQQQRNLDQLIARLEASMQSQGSAVIANLGPEQAARATALIESQRQAAQGQLARLKTLRSNGRIALEIDPSQQHLAALPALPLEDGDRVVIPSVPGFVAAFGSVNNENVFVFRPGRTVGDVVRLAGLTEDADQDQTFVLRADGTVVANRDRSGWFSSNLESLALMPGDTVVVPQKVDRESRLSFFTRYLKDFTQIFANLGLGLAALRSL